MNRKLAVVGIGLAILILISPRTVMAKDYQVANADALASATKELEPGDTVVLADGVWKDADLLMMGQGTIDAPILFRTASPGGVTLSGNTRIRIAGDHVTVDGFCFRDAWHKSALVEFRKDSKHLARSCRLTNIDIDDCNPPDLKTENKFVSIYGKNHTVDHCYLAGKRNPGATMVVWLSDDSGGHTIEQNHFGPRPVLGRNGGETIRVGDSQTAYLSANVTVQANRFERCDGEAETISNKSCDNVYRGNLFVQCSGTLTLRHGRRCLVDGNVFLGNKARGSGGVRIIGIDHCVTNNYFEALEGDHFRSALAITNGIPASPANGYEPVSGAKVVGNTFIECKRSILIGADIEHDSQVAPQNCSFTNNLIVSRRGPMIDLQNPGDRHRWIDNRCFGKGNRLGEGQDPADPDSIVTRLDQPPAIDTSLRDQVTQVVTGPSWRQPPKSPRKAASGI
ncbi:polysaccharide lyase 6 family protein [Rubripirellula reticaptiva]|nr:polysaccharide lyase 6 family protein [Rubripirellula reticaptiva]